MNVSKRKGAITLPHGFVASGLPGGIKQKSKRDLALVFSEEKCRAAAVFTKNAVKGWSVMIDQAHLRRPYHRGVFINSGNANCCNGIKNKKKIIRVHRTMAGLLDVEPHEIFSASTGIIGRDFPLEAVLHNAPALVQGLSRKGGHAAAEAILTTDTRTKEAVVSFSVKGKKVTLSAMGKGAGMLHPNMATMLVFLTTDLHISKPLLQSALKTAAHKSFNSICVDNDMSTNDTVLMLANGACGNPLIKTKNKYYYLFLSALEKLCKHVATELVKDGEGVSKICHISVVGARNDTQAGFAARSVANSMLFKTALHGGDPNWGRIVAALGAHERLTFSFDRLTIAFNHNVVLKRGKPSVHNTRLAARAMKKKEVFLTIDLGVGSGRGYILTSDLSKEYVRINADYTT